MKLGTDTNSVVRNMISRSGQRLRQSAAMEPRINPSTTAKAAAMPPSFAEVENFSEMIWEISRPVFSEMPKSPRARLRR